MAGISFCFTRNFLRSPPGPGLFYGIIWPEKGLVVAVHEGAIIPEGPQKTLDTLYENLLLPMLDEPLEPVQEDYQALLHMQSSLRLPSDESNGLSLNDAFSGSYRVVSGAFDPWLAVSPPGSGDLFAAFRDRAKDVLIRSFSLKVQEEALFLTLDTGATMTASWDGALAEGTIDSPYPGLGAYAASARFTDDQTLELRIHWINGWFETIMIFQRANEAFNITTKKLRLNPEDNYLIYCTTAKREA